jgi:DNA replication protein DnaC
VAECYDRKVKIGSKSVDEFNLGVKLKSMIYKLRQCQNRLQKLKKKSRGRIIALTGARQVGKTTLAQHCFSEIPLLSMDSPIERETRSQAL